VREISGTPILQIMFDRHKAHHCWSAGAATVCATILACGFAIQSGPARSQNPVTMDDLQGAIMEASATNQRLVRVNGREVTNKYQTDWTIRFISAEAIRSIFVGTTHDDRGAREAKGSGRVVDVNLARPSETKSRGGGHQVWIFENGVLTYLRTYEGGGMKATFAMNRDAAGFSCTTNVAWPREVGIPSIKMRSDFDNQIIIELLSTKQIASSCRIKPADR